VETVADEAAVATQDDEFTPVVKGKAKGKANGPRKDHRK
jgi:hypothetical protein